MTALLDFNKPMIVFNDHLRFVILLKQLAVSRFMTHFFCFLYEHFLDYFEMF